MRPQDPGVPGRSPRPPESTPGRGRFLFRLAIGALLGAAALLAAGEWSRAAGGG